MFEREREKERERELEGERERERQHFLTSETTTLQQQNQKCARICGRKVVGETVRVSEREGE